MSYLRTRQVLCMALLYGGRLWWPWEWAAVLFQAFGVAEGAGVGRDPVNVVVSAGGSDQTNMTTGKETYSYQR